MAGRMLALSTSLLCLLTAALPPQDPSVGQATILEEDLEAHVNVLAAPALMGRDSPSLGLQRAARYISARFAEAGLESPDGDDFLLPFELDVPAPLPTDCRLELSVEGEEARTLDYGKDFVPVAGCEGTAEGELVFLGFGIDAGTERYDEIPSSGIKGKVAVILEGEPRHKKRFDGEETTRYAALWTKLENFEDSGVAGLIVVRRAAAGEAELPEEMRGEDAHDVGFRHQWATWSGAATVGRPRDNRSKMPPVIEVDPDAGAVLLGTDVEALALKADRTGKAPRHKLQPRGGRSVSFTSATTQKRVAVDNVVGVVRGSDPELSQQFVVVGAHYDHVGVDAHGRIGCGADDNASGTAAVIEMAQALAASPPRRSVLLCAFAAEEKGLLGSKALVDDSPIVVDSMVAMVNMDMLGRGKRDEVAVLGVEVNEAFEPILERAKKLSRTGVKKMTLRQGQELWQRSDHYNFHEAGVPSLFFFEGLPISANKDYHTWRDTIERLDLDKVTRSTRLIFNTVWLLANDDETPPRPRG